MRKRSKYRPKPIRVDTMAYVQSSVKKFDEISVAVNLRIRNHDALEALRLGSATHDDIDTLIFAFNMAEGLLRVRTELGRDWAAEVQAAQDAIRDVVRRGIDRNSFICRAEEWKAMTLVMEVHDAQLDQSTVKDLEQAMDVIAEDVRNKRTNLIREKK